MEEPELVLNEKNQGAFVIMDGDKQLAEMVLAVADQEVVVYHTEVSPEAEGKGLAKKLLDAMVAYARTNNFKVVPLCPYVHAQFKRHPEDYQDVWKKIEE